MTPDFLIASRHQSIAHFDAQIEYLRRQVRDLIATDEALQQSFELLVSTTSIADASAINSSVSCWSCPRACVPSNGAPRHPRLA